ncbi:DUF5131 family protein [Mycolicibacterium sphagni]|uniref:DUF5131 family protein n=1 Tax=Mycolicibacterium sphagni TaxID=1786 RepID=UPI0021F2A69F|nr:phage Gp37/Gp68 family protein [Mycolicibacterium sphagni]MCV7175092.1 phage Gp37/Gp68 family protein [Mycolicibacterium sphagni]
MGSKTKIEWTRSDDGTPGATWNPATGCTKVSPGCDRCYAETLAERFRGTPGHYYENGFDVTLRPGKLLEPLKWSKPRRIFVNSMSDLFHDQIPDHYIAKVFAVMELAPWHSFQLLTKRHGRMHSLLNSLVFQSQISSAVNELLDDGAPFPKTWDPEGHKPDWPLPNVWLGVTVENQQWADIRIPLLIDTPATIRWLSIEPMLGPVDLFGVPFAETPGPAIIRNSVHWFDPNYGDQHEWDDQPGIDWVVCGGESGRGARPMHPKWATDLMLSCSATGVPFLFKQWGEWRPYLDQSNGHRQPDAYMNVVGELADEDTALAAGGDWIGMHRLGKSNTGRELDGRLYDEYPVLAGAHADL